jgi:uncharacterized protein YndB with AHSA1/START domain
MTDDPEARRGVVTTEDDGRLRLEYHRSWPDPLDDVWAALTEPERLARWIGRYEGPRGAGATGTFVMTQEEGDQSGQGMTIVECEPPRRLVVEWEPTDYGHWRVELDLRTEGDRTLLRFVQHFPAGTDVADMAMGWHWYLDKLGAELGDGTAPTDWDAFVAGVRHLY